MRMIFSLHRFSVVAYANGFTLWHYNADESDRRVLDEDAFDSARDLLSCGDVIIVSGMVEACVLFVSTKTKIVKTLYRS